MATPRSTEMHASERWHDTGVDVRAGETIAVATEELEPIYDKHLAATVAGLVRVPCYFRNPMIRRCLRHPSGTWFALTGCIDQDLTTCFEIGDRPAHVMPATGRLYLFFNDVERFYSNNRGKLRVTITTPD